MPDRLRSLDVARGIAALAVVFWHWQHFFMDVNPLSHDNNLAAFDAASQPLYSWFSGFYEHGYRAVMFFFVLSGFVFFWLYSDSISQRRCSLQKFAVLRFARLYPLHLATLLIVALLQWYCREHWESDFAYSFNDGYHFGLHLIGISYWGFESGYSYNAPTWSVSLELGLYAIFFLVAYLGHTTWRKTLGIAAIALLLERLHLGGRWAEPVGAFFLGGLTYYGSMQYLKRRTNRSDVVLYVATLLVWVGFSITGKFVFRTPVFPLTILTLIVTEIRFSKLFQPLAWIGDITYSTYLLHFPLQLVFVITAIELGFDSGIFYHPATLLTYLAILIPGSWLTFHYFERPLQTWLRGALMSKPISRPAERATAPLADVSAT
ncbi:acyltransferase family protein [Novipirellula sp.]|uniref:acyltransferase family protein n=1 Tax=Novipirellula sp. TaxID=2795430 RepID=UPI003563440E